MIEVEKYKKERVMELDHSGFTVWYATSDAPAPATQVAGDCPQSLTIGVRPAHPANGLDVVYRLDEGPDQEMHATLARTDYLKNRQFFCAEFPPLSEGSRVEYAPVVRQAGRRIDFRQGGRYPSSFFVEKSKQEANSYETPHAITSPLDLHPYRLEHLSRGDLSIAKDPEVIGETPEGIRLNFRVLSGTYCGKISGRTCRSSDDWLSVRPDGIAILDTKITIATHDHAVLLLAGSGTVDLGPDGYRNVKSGHYSAKARVVEVVRFLSSDPKYAWLDRLQCMAIGYANAERVCYDVYGIHSLCT